MGMSNAIIRFGLDRGNSKKQVFTNGLLSILLGYAGADPAVAGRPGCCRIWRSMGCCCMFMY